jgi:predicted RNA-binding Zn-ribbon protein involved in translation (DUF1610 family)
MSSFWGPPPASPPEPTRAERRHQEQEKKRQIAEEEYHLREASCAKCGKENDETYYRCSDCRNEGDNINEV